MDRWRDRGAKKRTGGGIDGQGWWDKEGGQVEEWRSKKDETKQGQKKGPMEGYRNNDERQEEQRRGTDNGI